MYVGLFTVGLSIIVVTIAIKIKNNTDKVILIKIDLTLVVSHFYEYLSFM